MKRLAGALIMMKVGYEFGLWDCKDLNEKLSKQNVVEFESEEQIFDFLINKNATAVFLYLYSPGHFLFEHFNKSIEIESANPRYIKEEIVFMRVHCRHHLTFCVNKMW